MATGGMDSTTLLYDLCHRGYRPVILTVDYGHCAFPKQMELLQYHAHNLGDLPIHTIEIKYHDWQVRGEGLFTPGYVCNEENPLGEWNRLRYEETFIEGRNMIMVAYALSFCSAHNIDELYAGYLYGEEEWENRRTYKLMTGDNSPQFVDMMNLLTNVGLSHQVRIRAPFYERKWSKKDVYEYGKKVGVDFDKTYSCYFIPACGKCDNCLLRKQIMGE
jgi:7-cyano-7-deazaguanine synthase in queuosine biosynthesis